MGLFMGLSYAVEEMRMIFPFPFKLEMDNDAARIFCLGTAHRTKLKHIDCRQDLEGTMGVKLNFALSASRWWPVAIF